MQISVDQTQKETKAHGSKDFPVLISRESLSRYERGQFLPHWHPQVEFTYVLEGEISYHVNDIQYHLQKDDGLFCNANAIHSGQRHLGHDCRYLSVTFLPKVIYGFESSRIKNNYVDKIVQNPLLTAVPFSVSDQAAAPLLADLATLHQISDEPRTPSELRILAVLLSIWDHLYTHCSNLTEHTPHKPVSGKTYQRLKEILDFIHKNYAQKILLADIADEIGISQSECCRFFKKYMNTTVQTYITDYRIERSLSYLQDKDLNITEIAYMTGFSNASFYSKTFKSVMGCTPFQYRNR